MAQPSDLIAQSLAEHRLNKWYFDRWQRDNKIESPKVLAYLDGNARPADSEVLTHYGRGLLLAEDARRALIVQEPPRPASSVTLPASKVVLDPGEIAAWMVSDSAGTQIATAEPHSGNSHNLVAWGACQYLTNPLYPPPKKTYAIHGFRLIAGNPGRMFNYHTAPACMPYGWTPPAYPGGPRKSVSPIAIDYFGDNRGLYINAQPEGDGSDRPHHYTLLTKAEVEARRGQWESVIVEIGWGRIDGGYPPGSLRAWVRGEATPRANVSGINTHYPEQHFTTLWEGAYTFGGASSRVEVEVAARRIGPTLQSCLGDRPTVFTRYGAGVPPGAISAIPDVTSTVGVPPGL